MKYISIFYAQNIDINFKNYIRMVDLEILKHVNV